MSDARADIIRVLHQAYIDNGWMPPTLDGYADALMAAGYGKVDGDADKVEAVLALCAEMVNANTERGTMPGVRMQVRRDWADRFRAVLCDVDREWFNAMVERRSRETQRPSP